MLFPGFNWWTIPLWLGALWLLMRLLPSAQYFLQILKMGLQPPQIAATEASEVPECVREMLWRSTEKLKDEGFVAGCFLKICRITRSLHSRTFGLLLYHPERATYAEICVAEAPDVYEPVKATFWTLFEDGPGLMTLNGADYGLLGEFPNLRAFDPYASSLEEQWRAHCEELGKVEGRVLVLSSEEFLARVRREYAGYFDLAKERGTIQPRDEGEESFEFSWSAVWRVSFRLHRRVPQLKKLKREQLKRRQSAPAADHLVPVDVQVHAYNSYQNLKDTPNRRHVATGLLLLSGLLFGLSMLLYFSAEVILLVIVVLALHEAGHYAAMRACGYRNTGVLFIPFLGAVAKGVKERTGVREELLVFLAGPVPGLLLGLALRWSARSDWAALAWTRHPIITEFCLLLIVINLFNLLPVYPLDGGRILHRLFFIGRPYGEAFFAAVGAAIFLLLGVLAGEFILTILGVVLAIAVWQRLKTARLEKRLLRELESRDAEPLLPRVFAFLDDNSQQPLPFFTKFSQVQQLERRLGEARAGWAGAAAGIAAYVASIWIGVLALI